MDVSASSTLNGPDGAEPVVGAPAPDSVVRLFEMTSELLATISTDGRFAQLNPAWQRLLGWTREELQAKPISAFLHGDDVAQGLAPVLVGPAPAPNGVGEAP